MSAAGQSTAASEGGVTMVGVGAEGVPDRSLGTPPCGGSPAPTVTTTSFLTFLRTLSPGVPTARKSHPSGEISSKLQVNLIKEFISNYGRLEKLSGVALANILNR